MENLQGNRKRELAIAMALPILIFIVFALNKNCGVPFLFLVPMSIFVLWIIVRLTPAPIQKEEKENEKQDESNEDVEEPSNVEVGEPYKTIDKTNDEIEDSHNKETTHEEIEVEDNKKEQSQQDTIEEHKKTKPEEEEVIYRNLEPYDPKLDLPNYRYPIISLLDDYGVENMGVNEEVMRIQNEVIKVLYDFGIRLKDIKPTVGATVTLFEMTPANGVRVAMIRGLEEDVAFALSVPSVRIIAPMPGRGTIGIEVPNDKPHAVSMAGIINTRKFQECEYELPIAIGKTSTNENFITDLTKMPHLLITGTTGMGKSVCLSAIITSLLYKKHPAELKLVMINPKMVDLAAYSPIVNHFLAQVEGTEDVDEPIIYDTHKVINTLNSLCLEMDNRYLLLNHAGVRDIKTYNDKFKARKLLPTNGHRFLPYIVVVIDEFGGLIAEAGDQIENPMCRIAQLARAVGIHMVIATQRPSVDVITGNIKANFPSRISFRLPQWIDSYVALDERGAEQLLGAGDMIFKYGANKVRMQCAYVSAKETDRIVDYIARQQGYARPYPLPDTYAWDDEDGDSSDIDFNHLDSMFEEVARFVVNTQQGSTSMIQRNFAIGYNRAGRLMAQLEAVGIVGPAHGSKPREVLCMSEEDLQFLLDSIK